jgi:DNA-binding MarR family transcriptional regulator
MDYIVKKQDPQDKRIIYLTLSQKGIEYITKVIYASQNDFWKRLSVLSDIEIEELISSFTKIQTTFIKMRELNKHK